MIVAILRFVIPIIIILVIVRLIWPRYQQFKKRKADRIEVEAEVVNSEQHTPPDIPHTAYTTKASDASSGAAQTITSSTSSRSTKAAENVQEAPEPRQTKEQ